MADDGAFLQFRSVEFANFKGHPRLMVQLKYMNILVGSNNAGKSTIIAAFRALDVAIRVAGRRAPQPILGPGGNHQYGWRLAEEQFPISLENVRTDYNDVPAMVKFTLSNRKSLTLWFAKDEEPRLFVDTGGKPVRTAAGFKAEFPIRVGVVPVLGPVEHEEKVIARDTIVRNLATHRAARNFRNYWCEFSEKFDIFSALIESTWPGMSILRPERAVTSDGVLLTMMCREGRILRELFWVGFGFQIWCQLLTHIVRNADSHILVLDEPETYLHPEVQRRLLGILRDASPAVLLATHSTEIIAEADAGEILIVQKGDGRVRRVDAEGVGDALASVGSTLNPALSRLARDRRVVFFGGDSDFKLLGRFARKLGRGGVADGVGFVVVPMGGFSNWERVKHLGWGIERTLGTALSLGIVVDRDYRTDEEIESVRVSLSEHLSFVHVLSCKEVENLLINIDVLVRATQKELGSAPPGDEALRALIYESLDSFRPTVESKYLAARLPRKPAREADATACERILGEFSRRWADMSERVRLVPGRETLAKINNRIRDEYKVNLTHARIVDAFRVDEVPFDVHLILGGLEAFRLAPPPTGSDSNYDS